MDQGTDQELELDSTGSDGVEEIEDDVTEARVQMGQTIDAIQERLSIPAISAQIKDEVSEHISNAVQTTREALYGATIRKIGNYMGNIATQIKRSGIPRSVGGFLPLVLIGAGVGLMVRNRRIDGGAGSRRVQNGSRTGNGSGSDSSLDDSSKVGKAYEEVKTVASDTYHRLGATVSSTASRLGDAATSGKEMYEGYYVRNPLAVGAVATALGLAVGAALPLTQTESEVLGETAATVKEKVQEAAGGAIESVRESAETFVDNIAEGGQNVSPGRVG
jgi:hypothetical protein